MGIWFDEINLEEVNAFNKNTMISALGIIVTAITDDAVLAEMDVSEASIQPFKMLHGGASCVLAESLGSIGSHLLLDPRKFHSVGQSINANHISSACLGEKIFAKAAIVHHGRRSHIWEIKITNKAQKLICISRLTMAIIQRS